MGRKKAAKNSADTPKEAAPTPEAKLEEKKQAPETKEEILDT
jgi:hypothetical protein